MPTRKGRKNKRTLYREHRERVKQANAAINGEAHIGESLAVMAEAMEFFVQIARNTQEDLEERKASSAFGGFSGLASSAIARSSWSR